MSDLVEFLVARYAEEENAAHEILDRRGAAFIVTMFAKNSEIPDKFARRVLAEVAAKRRIIDEHPITTGWDGDGCDRPICLTCSTTDQSGGLDGDPYPCRTLRLLASPYADHENYRAEWAV